MDSSDTSNHAPRPGSTVQSVISAGLALRACFAFFTGGFHSFRGWLCYRSSTVVMALVSSWRSSQGTAEVLPSVSAQLFICLLL